MNIINRALLRLALLPSPLYRKINVDVSQLRAILSTKLTLDDRRPGTLQQTRARKSSRPVKSATIATMFSSALMGLVFLLAFVIGNDIITQLCFYYSFFFFMLS